MTIIFQKQLTNLKLWFVHKKLETALKIKENNRLKLKNRIILDLSAFLKLHGISEYIPYDHKSREKIKQFVDRHYGEQLKELDINYKITKSNGFKFL
jgi:hypothetical protein